MIEDEAESINEAIIKREKARKDGNEAEVKSIEKLLKERGFEIKEKDDIVSVRTRKRKDKI